MITDDRMAEIVLANKYSSDPLAIYRAIEAEVHEELRKQEPVAWIHPLYKDSGFKLVGITRWSDDCLPLYAAPIAPEPTPSQQEALDHLSNLLKYDSSESWVAVKAFILARPDAPIPPEPTPSQQARPLDEWDEWNGNVLWWKFPIDEPPYVGTPLDTDWPKYHTHWTPLGVPDMPLPAPIPPTNMRAEFEKWASHPNQDASLARDSHGDYISFQVQGAWDACQLGAKMASAAPIPPKKDTGGTIKDECNSDCFYECDHHCPPCPLAAPIPPDNHDWKAEYLRQVDLHNQTLDELREAEMQLRNPAPTPPTPSQQESVPKGFIVVSKDLLAEAIACNTDASLAEARHIINSVLKVSDDDIFREVLKEESK